MQELKIFSWCDVCHAEGGQGEAAVSFLVNVVPIGALGRAPVPRRLDLCEPHSKPVLDVAELMKMGTIPPAPKAEEPSKPQPVPKPRPEPKPASSEQRWGGQRMPCPVCEMDLTNHAVVDHLLGIHGAKRIVQPKKCPDCGSRFDLGQAMATHRRKVHGWSHVAELVKRIKR